eukprot:362819-Chlamydomonas_euryale.AAC.1
MERGSRDEKPLGTRAPRPAGAALDRAATEPDRGATGPPAPAWALTEPDWASTAGRRDPRACMATDRACGPDCGATGPPAPAWALTATEGLDSGATGPPVPAWGLTPGRRDSPGVRKVFEFQKVLEFSESPGVLRSRLW